MRIFFSNADFFDRMGGKKKRQPKDIGMKLDNSLRVGVAVLVMALMGPKMALAASYDCAKASTATEQAMRLPRAVCLGRPNGAGLSISQDIRRLDDTSAASEHPKSLDAAAKPL